MQKGAQPPSIQTESTPFGSVVSGPVTVDAAELNAFVQNKMKLQAESLKAEFLEQMQQEMKKA